MSNILFSRTFIIVGGMLLVTAITARINKAFETAAEMWITLIGTFVFLFAVIIFANFYPVNLVLVTVFSGFIGWEIGPTIELYGKRFKLKKFAKSKGVTLKKGDVLSLEQSAEFEQALAADPQNGAWHNIVFQALLATAIAVFATAGIVFLTDYNFGFLGGFLFIALLFMIVMGIVNLFFFRSPMAMLARAYMGVIIFTLYLLYDFDRLEKMADDRTWGAAIDIAVNIYLDIINLFLDLLQILGDSSD